MLFNSYEYVFAFLPVSLALYWTLIHWQRPRSAIVGLVASSLFFYAWWDPRFLTLIVASVLVNYSIARFGIRRFSLSDPRRKWSLIAGISINLLLLSRFKYWDFLIDNLNLAFGFGVSSVHVALPLAISFFTFQQIAYLVDSYKELTGKSGLLDYALFITFFPQLIAGPIVHHSEMMPQFREVDDRRFDFRTMSTGIYIFCIGLCKKVLIADMFAYWANFYFDDLAKLDLLEAWAASLSFTLQLYFDFSGYTDMAVGAALLFGIRLPKNFDSPYKATHIRDFWRRWHMTLGRFLRDYVYIPLGGNKNGQTRLLCNLFVTFLLGGLWHGAAWTFVVWGALHGLAMMAHRIWSSTGMRMPKRAAWALTFFYVNLTWVFFRANDWASAKKVIWGMFGATGFGYELSGWSAFEIYLFQNQAHLSDWLVQTRGGAGWILLLCGIFLGITFFAQNTNRLSEGFEPSWRRLGLSVFTLLMFIVVNSYWDVRDEFIYFRF